MRNPIANRYLILTSAATRLLRPLVRILLRYGVSFDEFAELAKQAYVRVAIEDFAIEGRKPSGSRVSVLTGLTRKEVTRLLNQDDSADHDASARYNRAARVIAGWVRDERFKGRNGTPKALPLDGDGDHFSELVRLHGGDVPVRAVLDELLRVGAVELTPDNRAKLVTRAYVPRAGELDKLAILGGDVADLIETIDHNLEPGDDGLRFQRKVMYDNLPVEALAEFRSISAENAQLLLEKLDLWLSAHDRDENPTVVGTGRMRAGLGVFYFEENMKSPTEET